MLKVRPDSQTPMVAVVPSLLTPDNPGYATRCDGLCCRLPEKDGGALLVAALQGFTKYFFQCEVCRCGQPATLGIRVLAAGHECMSISPPPGSAHLGVGCACVHAGCVCCTLQH